MRNIGFLCIAQKSNAFFIPEEERVEKMRTQKISTSWLVKVALLGAVASILMFFEITIPFVPPFLKLDFSDIPAFLAGFALGPVAGVAVLLIKNIVHSIASWSFLVGELANFFIGISFVLPAALIYNRNKSRKSALIGMVTGGLTMTLFAALANYFVLIPLYATVLKFPLEAIIGMSSEVNKYIVDLNTLVMLGITPFNIFKAIVNIVITMIVYKKLSPVLHFEKRK